MMARRREERYQDVGVILEDLASYESRGLLRSSDSGAFMPVPAVAGRDAGRRRHDAGVRPGGAEQLTA